MEFWSALARLIRRKAVIVPATLTALVASGLAYVGTPDSYASSTTMVLTTTEYGGTLSQDPADPTALTNPMLNFNDSLRTTAAILIQAMNTRDVAKQLGARGSTTLVVDDGRSNPSLFGLSGPFVYVEVDGSSPQTTLSVLAKAQQLMKDKLRSWQLSLSAPPDTYVSLVEVVPPTAPKAQHARAAKLATLAFLLVFVSGLGVAYLRDRLRRRRRDVKPEVWGPSGASPHGTQPPKDSEQLGTTGDDTAVADGEVAHDLPARRVGIEQGQPVAPSLSGSEVARATAKAPALVTKSLSPSIAVTTGQAPAVMPAPIKPNRKSRHR
jgi:hypothetical protein